MELTVVDRPGQSSASIPVQVSSGACAKAPERSGGDARLEQCELRPVSLGQRVVSAVGWSIAVKVGFQIVTWVMTLAVIRVLLPEDYGLMALVMVCINVLAGFSNLGLGDALVQQGHTPKPLVASVFGLMLLISAVLTILTFLAAYPIAAWYHEPRLVSLLQVAGLGFPLNALTTVPRIYLVKSLRIRPMLIMEMSSGLAASLTVIILAYSGYGVWALMLGGLLGTIARVIGFVMLTNSYWTWPSFRFGLVRPLLSFGAFRTLEYLAWVAFTSADALIIGWWLGSADLGLYSVALNFAAMPLSKIAPIINSIAFPAFALTQGNPADARFYALKAMRLMAMLAVPVFFGISAIAPEIIDLVFGPQWVSAKPMLAVLALATTFRAILLVLPNFLQGIGDARAGFWCTLSGAVLFPPAFIVGCAWGVEGVCYAWLVGYPVVFFANAMIAARWGGLDLWTLLLTPLRPMAAGAAMILAVAFLRPWLQGPEPMQAAILIAAGAAVYIGVLIVAFRSWASELLSIAIILRSRAR